MNAPSRIRNVEWYGENFWPLMSWGKYLAFSDILRERYEAVLDLPDEELSGDDLSSLKTSIRSPKRAHALQKSAAFAYYHASLLPVIEGWQELGLKDPKIDDLLLHPDGYYTAARRHRNAIFHFQKEFFGSKESEIYEKGEKMPVWIILLQGEFTRWLRQTIDEFPGLPEQKKEIRELARDIIGWLPPSTEDVTEETAQVLRYVDRELARADLSDRSRDQLSAIKAHAEMLPAIADEAFASLKRLRAEWLSIIT